MKLPVHVYHSDIANQNAEVEKQVQKFIDKLGEENIVNVSKQVFFREDDNVIAGIEPYKNSKLQKNNRYFTNPTRWIREKVSAAHWLGLHLTKDKRILDLGTGAGWFIYVCRQLGHECFGTDIVDRLEYEAGYKFLNVDIIGELTYPMQKMNINGTFDYITTMRSFLGQRPSAWSKEEWKFFLEDMGEHLNNDGYLFLACNKGSKLDHRYRHLDDNEKSFWGHKELQEWFNPYVIPADKQYRGMRPSTLYIHKKNIKKLLDS